LDRFSYQKIQPPKNAQDSIEKKLLCKWDGPTTVDVSIEEEDTPNNARLSKSNVYRMNRFKNYNSTVKKFIKATQNSRLSKSTNFSRKSPLIESDLTVLSSPSRNRRTKTMISKENLSDFEKTLSKSVSRITSKFKVPPSRLIMNFEDGIFSRVKRLNEDQTCNLRAAPTQGLSKTYLIASESRGLSFFKTGKRKIYQKKEVQFKASKKINIKEMIPQIPRTIVLVRNVDMQYYSKMINRRSWGNA